MNYEQQTITEVAGGETYRYVALGEHVVRAVGVCGGRPTFKYKRIEITGAGTTGGLSRAAVLEAVGRAERDRL